MYHYVYRLDDKTTGEFYFGSRSTFLVPEDDPYMGSMISWKPDKRNLKKTVVRFDFSTRDEAVEFERTLILDHSNNSLCRNAHIPDTGFHTTGLGQYVDDFGVVHRVKKDDERVLRGELKPFWFGKTHSKESKLKMSISAKKRRLNPTTEKKRRSSIASTLLGKQKSDQHRENIRLAKIGSANPMKGKTHKKIQCTVCLRSIAVTGKRYHFENCKG